MKHFDRLITPECEEAITRQRAQSCVTRDPRCDDPAFAQANPSICGVDPRCTDPSFAEANPQICGPTTSTLVLKPSATVLCKDKTIQLHTFIRQGTNETEITSGVTYRSSDQSIALVGAIGGNVSGVGEGQATVSAEWMGKTAYAQIQVKPTEDCCEEISNRIVVLIDVSKSMSVVFGGTYATKLAFAKAAAVKFVNGVDLTKDSVALYTFAEAVTQVRNFSTDRPDLLNAIASLATTPQKTNVFEGLEEAVQAVNAAEVPGSRKIIVVISDFENKLGENPVPLAETFFESGGIIIVVGVRTHGAGYVLGNRVATGGFFMNAYPAVATLALSSLDGVKAYFCSGACIPDGDLYASRAAFDFDDFTQWNTLGTGKPDLIGQGSDGVQLSDLIPGNGLYIDGCGTAETMDAEIETKATFTFLPGSIYRITLRVAGNQRSEANTGQWLVYMGTILLGEVITRTWDQNFTDEVIDFTVAASTPATLRLVYQNTSGLAGNEKKIGLLLDLVKIENVTTGAILLMETWDNENVQYIPPGCGAGVVEMPGGGYAYGYNCSYTDCLNIPPGTQKPDPQIAPEVEDEPPPPVYTSTKSATAICPTGYTGSSVTRTATATSLISQADADSKAQAQAALLAGEALVCVHDFRVGDMISVAFHKPPILKSGFAATGVSSFDEWNSAFTDYGNLKFVDGTLANVRLYTAALWGENVIPTHPDLLMQKYALGEDGVGDPAALSPVIGPLPVGEYDIYAYAHGADDADNATFQAQVGAYNESTSAFTAESSYMVKSTENGSDWRSPAWVEGKQFVKFKVVVGTAGKWIRLLQTAGATGLFIVTGLQLVKTSAAPDAGAITIGDATSGTPFPSVKFIEGQVGLITSIQVNIFGFRHTFPDDVDMLLVGPDGTHVMLMSDCGGGLPGIPTAIDFVLEDTGGNPDLPDAVAFPAGTYHTKDYNAIAGETLAYGGIAPPGPHSVDLTAFIGKPANGAWKLYVFDDTAGDNGVIANWTLTIVSA